MPARLIMFLLSLLALSTSPPVGASPYQDSLRIALEQVPESDTGHIRTLQRIARSYLNDSTRYSIQLLTQSLELSRSNEYMLGEVLANEKLGVAYDILGNLDSALWYYHSGLQLVREHPTPAYDTMYFMINIGVAYFFAGELGKALEYYLIAENLAVESESKSELSYLLNNQGVIYRMLGKYEDAIRVYKRSLEMKHRAGDLRGVANTELNIANAYLFLKEPEAALPYIRQAKARYLQLNDTLEAQSVDLTLGIGLFLQGRTDTARQILEQAVAHPFPQAYHNNLCEAHITLAKIYLANEQPRNGLQQVQIASQLMAGTNWNSLKKNKEEVLANIYASLQQYDSAYASMQRLMNLERMLNSEDRQSLEEEMEARYAVRDKNSQIRLQQLELSKANRQQWLLAAGIAALLAIVGLLYWLFRTRNIANRQLQKALTEKEVLLREIHHRVKNNLQVISSLLSLQSRQIDDPKAQEVMQEGRNRVKSMALIHQDLYQDETLVGVNAADYIRKLTKSLISSYRIRSGHIDVNTDVDQIQLDVDVIIPLGLIMNELISNALKYAFPDDHEHASLDIGLKEHSQGISLTVADNGRGLPEGFDPDQSPTLGMYLVSSFAKKLNASFSLISENGTSATIFIPSTTLT